VKDVNSLFRLNKSAVAGGGGTESAGEPVQSKRFAPFLAFKPFH
jgi:hypothetical protein